MKKWNGKLNKFINSNHCNASGDDFMSEQEYNTIETMEKYGGSFVKSLANCFRMADRNNFLKLKNAFSVYWEQYEQMSKKKGTGGNKMTIQSVALFRYKRAMIAMYRDSHSSYNENNKEIIKGLRDSCLAKGCTFKKLCKLESKALREAKKEIQDNSFC